MLRFMVQALKDPLLCSSTPLSVSPRINITSHYLWFEGAEERTAAIENWRQVWNRSSLYFHFKGWLVYVNLLLNCCVQYAGDHHPTQLPSACTHTQPDKHNLGTFLKTLVSTSYKDGLFILCDCRPCPEATLNSGFRWESRPGKLQGQLHLVRDNGPL
jgi:hypothetical protein